MEKIWLANYPPGVPAEISDDLNTSITDIFLESVKKFADRPAYYSFGASLGYARLDKLTRDLAAFFQHDLGLQKGDRLAIMLPNLFQYPVTLFAALRAGLTVVNVNPLYTIDELVHQMKDSGAKAIVVLANFLNTVKEALPLTALQHVMVTQAGDLLPRFKGWFMNFSLKYILKKVPRVNMPAIKFRDALAAGKKLNLVPVNIDAKDIAFLQYTGGTTGISKGAMLTHRNLVANVAQAEAWLAAVIDKGKDIFVTALPLYHVFALTANCIFVIKMGGASLLIANPRDISRMVADLARYRFTLFTGVNTLFNVLLKSPAFAKLDFSGLKLSMGGGMAVQRVVAEKWKAVTGKPLVEAYGLTETSPCVCFNPPALQEYNGTVGMPVSSTDIAVLDENHHEVAVGQPGELAIKGPQVMAGYWQNPAETRKIFTEDGWLLTGDIVSVDEKGYVKIRERKKDMILVSGFNVYPNEVEDVLMRMPGVREVGVVGVPDPGSGEVPKAFIVREPVSDRPEITAKDVLAYCQKHLTGYKVPRHIEFCTELPKSNVGKILRRALRPTPR